MYDRDILKINIVETYMDKGLFIDPLPPTKRYPLLFMVIISLDTEKSHYARRTPTDATKPDGFCLLAWIAFRRVRGLKN